MSSTSHTPIATVGTEIIPLKTSSSKTWRYLLLLLSLIVFSSITASAQILGTYCDGDPSDWANFQTTYPIHGYKLDSANAASNVDNQFTQGSKDGSTIASWRWSLGNANAKGDITNAGAVLTGTGNCILRFFGDRTSDNGDASIGFWFFKSDVSTNSNGTFSGVHTNGDLLILSDFTSGGTKPTIKVYEWQNGKLVLQSASSDNYCADVNHSKADVPAGFTYKASNGDTFYAPNLFYEGAIDLCALDISTCFAAFMVETRNSQSITASLQDFALGGFNATPARPAATVDQPTCSVATGTVYVTAPIAGYTYTLTGPSPATTTRTTSAAPFSFTGVAPGTYGLTASQGDCVSGSTTVVVNAQPASPARPVVTIQDALICGTNTTPTVTVSCPVVGKYILTQTGQTAQTFTYTGSNGPVVFTVVPGLGGFSITVTTGITTADPAGCTSPATNCTNYTTNSCPTLVPLAPAGEAKISAPTEQRSIRTEAYPNPTGRDATINFSVPRSGHVKVELYNAMGSRVATIFDGEAKGGVNNSILLRGAQLPTGTYYYKVMADGKTKSNRISLVK
jgi:hypothetical protein